MAARFVAPVIGGVLGAVFFLSTFGPAIVRPANLGWLMRHDTQTYLLAWHHFRREPWHWPPGAISSVGHPVGTSIGNADAIPLVAMPLKMLHAVLPDPLQYLGAWLLSCYVLQGVFGVLLVRQLTSDRVIQVLGAAMFVMAPALLHRAGHTALNAHWMLLATIWIANDRVHSRTWRAAAWTLLCAAVAATQPYLAVMVIGVALAVVASDWWADDRSRRSLRRAALEASAIIAAPLAVFWLCGLFLVGSVSDLGLSGFGHYSMNLLSPVMPMGYSRLLPDIPAATAGQYEGLVYFGAGWLMLAAAALVAAVRRGAVWPRLRLGWVVVAGFVALAISPVVTVGPAIVLDLSAWAPQSLSTFRSSGRFGWLLMYVVFAASLATSIAAWPRRTVTALLAAAVALQFADMSQAYVGARLRAVDPVWTEWDDPLKSPVWPVAARHYRHIVTVPPDMCGLMPNPHAPHLPFSLLAGSHGATINSGFAARYDAGAVQRYCAALDADVRAGRVDDDSLYVLDRPMREALAASTRAPLECGRIDGFDVCVTAASFAGWRDAATAAGIAMSPVPRAQP